MELLFAPWRENYAKSVSQNPQGPIETECPFCLHFKETEDEQNFILKRFKHMIVMLNRFPYNAGHLLILPHNHVADLNDVSSQARSELIELTNYSIEIVKEILGCQGVNVGINLGKFAGGGIPTHLHMHILPRFVGDTSFLPTLANTKNISVDLNNVYKKLKPSFEKLY